jgi:tripartite-type tricarboxylate transporter receptor subunit TctC
MIVPTMSGTVLEFQRAGKLRILAVCSPTRLAGRLELPTAAEQGFPWSWTNASLSLMSKAP